MASFVERVLKYLHSEKSEPRYPGLLTGRVHDFSDFQRERYVDNDLLLKFYDNPRFDGDSRVATEKEIIALGYKIKPGEEGVAILSGDISPAYYHTFCKLYANHPLEYEALKQKFFVTYYCGSQVESGVREFEPYKDEFLEPPDHEQKRQMQLLEQIADAFDVKIRHFGPNVAYLPHNNTIFVPTKRILGEADRYMLSVAHELTHVICLKNDPAPVLDQPKILSIPQYIENVDAAYALAEWRAELGGLRILDALDVKLHPSSFGNSADYLRSWARYKSKVVYCDLSAVERQQMIDQSLEAANTLLRAVDLKIEPTAEEKAEIKKLNSSFSIPPKRIAEASRMTANDGNEFEEQLFHEYCRDLIGLNSPLSEAFYAQLYSAAMNQNPCAVAEFANKLAILKSNTILEENADTRKRNDVCDEAGNDFKM